MKPFLQKAGFLGSLCSVKKKKKKYLGHPGWLLLLTCLLFPKHCFYFIDIVFKVSPYSVRLFYPSVTSNDSECYLTGDLLQFWETEDTCDIVRKWNNLLLKRENAYTFCVIAVVIFSWGNLCQDYVVVHISYVSWFICLLFFHLGDWEVRWDHL